MKIPHPSTISGTTRVAFVVADPVAHLRTPQVLNRIWADEERGAVAVPAHVAAAGLADFVAGLRVNDSAYGAVVTVPHKQDIVRYCDELGPNARRVGAVNVIQRTAAGGLRGETFDGLGFVEGLRAQSISVDGRRVVVLGAGGAASAVAVALLHAGAHRIDIANRTLSRAHELAERLRREGSGCDIGVGEDRLDEADLVINATSWGMRMGDGSPLEGRLPVGAIAAEVIMSDTLTPFLAAAAASGNRIHEGAHMLAGQATLIARFLTGDAA